MKDQTMRPTGKLHSGHLVGALGKRVSAQETMADIRKVMNLG